MRRCWKNSFFLLENVEKKNLRNFRAPKRAGKNKPQWSNTNGGENEKEYEYTRNREVESGEGTEAARRENRADKTKCVKNGGGKEN